MLKKITTSVFLTILTLLIIWGIGWIFFASNIAITKQPNPTIKADAIIVLTGGKNRIGAGQALFDKQFAPYMFISGVGPGVEKENLFPNNVRYMCCIDLGHQSTDTISNALEIEQWVKDNKVTSFYLVTSYYHMPRAVMEIKQRLPDAKIIKFPVISDRAHPWQVNFWRITFKEYNKALIRWMQNWGYHTKQPS